MKIVCGVLVLPLLCVHGLLCDNDNVPVEYSFLVNQTCTGPHIKETLSAMADCRPRLRVLRLPLPNGTELTQMTPTHVEVHRCGGGCNHLRQSCVARYTRMKVVPVIVAKCGISTGVCDKECGRVEVEEHVECECSCGLSSSDCSSAQRLHVERCMCECQDMEEMKNCRDLGRFWSHDTCSCQCPVSGIKVCGEGLVFDDVTCACIPWMKNRGSQVGEIGQEKRRGSNDAGFHIPFTPVENIIIGVLASILILFILLNISLVRNLRCLHRRVKSAQATMYTTIDKANFMARSDPFLIDDKAMEDTDSASSISTYSRKIDFNTNSSYKTFLKIPRADELPSLDRANDDLPSLDSESYIISVLETLPSPPLKDCRVRRLSSFS